MNATPPVRAVYEADGLYEQLLLPHYFDGISDTGLIASWMIQHFGEPAPSRRIAEFGCGTGRITTTLASYAGELVLADYSKTMIDAVTARFPQARTICADTRDAVGVLLDEHGACQFDLVTSFWSLSYPLGEYFETMTPAGDICAQPDPLLARAQAAGFVERLVDLLVPGGHLLVWLFDSDSPEQQLVTRAWEKVAPFPDGGRAYTRTMLLDALRDAEARGRGTLTYSRLAGAAVAQDTAAGREWFFGEHFKHHPLLLADLALCDEVEAFLARHRLPDGRVAIPSGAYVIDFRAVAHPYFSLPACSLPGDPS
ncbi:class I SAM-dependent methyltransferase [Nocardia nova]|uniref:class I SAM-dependent methyltransferase n=1 Tax=Nocardia nova TaxID=37330 RepID=UPI0033D0696C